jgi:hypothetical protein
MHLGEIAHGMPPDDMSEVLRTADVFLNVSGSCLLPEALSDGCVRVFVDTDPGYNQIVFQERPDWEINLDESVARVASHHRHFSYGENIGADDCLVPDAGYRWEPTRMPVVMDLWRGDEEPPADGAWTTVMSWSTFRGPVVLDGVQYGGKGQEFEKLLDLPARTDVSLRVALGGHAPIDRLRAAGWGVVDANEATRTPRQYRDLLRRSRGEVSTAKNVYVALRTGWFSTRTACYLAAGRPAVVQDTGFSAHLPVGDGVVPFDDADGARAGIEAVEANYRHHSMAALELAREEFAADRVLGRVLGAL